MLGAIAGDMVGSPYEGRSAPPAGFPLFPDDAVFTDDTVCTVAVAEAIMDGADFAAGLRRWVRRHPDAGYGSRFKQWAMVEGSVPSDSYGNGGAMRASPAGWAAGDAVEALALARASCRASHDHPEAIRGAEAVALAVFLARQGRGPEEIRRSLRDRLDLDVPLRPARFRGIDVTARGSVPPALACALAAADWETAVRSAVALGGDTDTVACMAGAVAEARHGLSRKIAGPVLARLPADLAGVVQRFRRWIEGGRR